MNWVFWARVDHLPLPQTRAGAFGTPQNQPGGDVFDRQRRLPAQPPGDRHFFRITLTAGRQILFFLSPAHQTIPVHLSSGLLTGVGEGYYPARGTADPRYPEQCHPLDGLGSSRLSRHSLSGGRW